MIAKVKVTILLTTILLLLGACAPIGIGEIREDGGDGEPIVLINNPNATDPTYGELVNFIRWDTTNQDPYFDFGEHIAYFCTDFAETLHNNAEANGIRAAWVSIDFQNIKGGHALNAFETTDRGLVYIDCTGRSLGSYQKLASPSEKLHPIPNSAISTRGDTIAYIKIGRKYGRIQIDQAKSLQYDFLAEYNQRWIDYRIRVERYNKTAICDETWEAELYSAEKELGYYHYMPRGTAKDIHIHWGGKE